MNSKRLVGAGMQLLMKAAAGSEFFEDLTFAKASWTTKAVLGAIALFWLVKIAQVALWLGSWLTTSLRGWAPAQPASSASMIDTAEEDDDDNALKPVQGKSLKALIKETRAVDPMNVAKSDERASKNRAFVAGLKGAGGGCAGINWWSGGTGGHWLVVACEDQVLRVYDMSRPVEGAAAPVISCRINGVPLGAAFLETPQQLAAICGTASSGSVVAGKGGAKGWEPAWALYDIHKRPPKCIVSAPTCGLGPGVVVTSAGGDDTTLCVSTAKGKKLETIDTSKIRNNRIAMSPDGKFLAAATFTSDCPVWEIRFDRNGDYLGTRKAFQLKGAHKAECYGVAFAASTPRMATVSKDGTVALWNIDVRYYSGEDPKLVCRWNSSLPGSQPYSHVALSPDAQIVACAFGPTVHLFSSSGALVDEITDAHTGGITDMAFSGTLKSTTGFPYLLATSGKDKRVRLWKQP